MNAKSLQLCPLLFDPKDCSPPGSSVYDSGLPCPPPGKLPDPGIELFFSLTLASRFLNSREALRHLTGRELKEYKLPLWVSDITCLQCERPGFNPCVGKIPWRKAWQPTPVFWPKVSLWTEEPSKL